MKLVKADGIITQYDVEVEIVDSDSSMLAIGPKKKITITNYDIEVNKLDFSENYVTLPEDYLEFRGSINLSESDIDFLLKNDFENLLVIYLYDNLEKFTEYLVKENIIQKGKKINKIEDVIIRESTEIEIQEVEKYKIKKVDIEVCGTLKKYVYKTSYEAEEGEYIDKVINIESLPLERIRLESPFPRGINYRSKVMLKKSIEQHYISVMKNKYEYDKGDECVKTYLEIDKFNIRSMDIIKTKISKITEKDI